MYMSTTLGEPQAKASCSGWESDPESFSKRVAEHYVRTVLGQSLSAKRIVPYYPSGNKRFMEVQFSPGLAVGVSFVKIPDYVIALRLRAQPPGPPRYYTYACTPKGDLVLSERRPPSTPQNPTTLRMREPLGEAEQNPRMHPRRINMHLYARECLGECKSTSKWATVGAGINPIGSEKELCPLLRDLHGRNLPWLDYVLRTSNPKDPRSKFKQFLNEECYRDFVERCRQFSPPSLPRPTPTPSPPAAPPPGSCLEECRRKVRNCPGGRRSEECRRIFRECMRNCEGVMV